MGIASIERAVLGAPRSGKPGALATGVDTRLCPTDSLVPNPSYNMAIMVVLPIGRMICRLDFIRLGIKLFSGKLTLYPDIHPFVLTAPST